MALTQYNINTMGQQPWQAMSDEAGDWGEWRAWYYNQ
jgi:hypothetical protein